LLRQFTTDRHFRTTNGANQVATIREFTQLHLLTEAEISKTITSWAIEATNANVAVQTHLVKSELALNWLNGCHQEEDWLIEIDLQ
jgi:hypothetical protein